MESFFAKQLIGNQLSGVKEKATEPKDPKEKEKLEQLQKERIKELKRAEKIRQERHKKREEQREAVRVEIRDKYGISKKEENKKPQHKGAWIDGGLNRKKKTHEELAAEQAAENEDDFTKMKNQIEARVNELKDQVDQKCSVQ